MENLKITQTMSGKMEGMASISTSCLTNPFCIAHRTIDGSVCQKCYAKRSLLYRKNNRDCFEKNMEILSSRIIQFDELPFLNYAYFRIEAFGDVANVTQAINYLNLVVKNPHCTFAWWTKNPIIIRSALRKLGFNKTNGKPKNLILILSSLMINQPTCERYWFIDKYFTVYDKKEAKNQNINCGGKKCISCLNCYKHNDIKVINEVLK